MAQATLATSAGPGPSKSHTPARAGWRRGGDCVGSLSVDNVFDYLSDCYLNYLIQINDHGLTDYCK